MWRVVALGLPAVAVLFVGVPWALQRRLIYFPDTASPVLMPGARAVQLHTSDGLSLGAWHIPSSDFTVLVANGNAGNRAARAPLASALSAAGFGVLLFDYRGYGGNPGGPSESGLALDVRAARQFLVDSGVRPDRLLYFGESLGAAVVAELATEHPPAGLLLRSPFVDLPSVGQAHYPFLPVRMLLRDHFPVAAQVARIDVPTTVVYGTADIVVPPSQSETVAKAARARVVTVDADHNDRALLDGAALIDAVRDLRRA